MWEFRAESLGNKVGPRFEFRALRLQEGFTVSVPTLAMADLVSGPKPYTLAVQSKRWFRNFRGPGGLRFLTLHVSETVTLPASRCHQQGSDS